MVGMYKTPIIIKSYHRPALVSRYISKRIYVPANFDTKEKAFSRAKAAEKGLK